MEIPDNEIKSIFEEIQQIQLGLRSVLAELEKWRKESGGSTAPTEEDLEGVEPPTEKQIVFLKGLGVEEIPASKEEARLLLHELNEQLEAGEYVVPPTAKQLKYLRNLKYGGPIPESKDAAWKLLQELNQRE